MITFSTTSSFQLWLLRPYLIMHLDIPRRVNRNVTTKVGYLLDSVLGPVHFLLYTYELHRINHMTTATFANKNTIMTVGHPTNISYKLQQATDTICCWVNDWTIVLNENVSYLVNFTCKRTGNISIIKRNDNIITNINSAKYLGINLGAKWRWKENIIKKEKEVKLELGKMDWLIGRKSIQNKKMLYTQILKYIWF